MRSIVLVILSAALLAGLFMLYWTMQPAARTVASGPAVKHVIVPPPSAEEDRLNSLSGIHPGDRVWFRQYDANQNLTSAFSADTFVPHPDGTVHVTSPLAQFFLANHQRIEVRGIDGNVVLKDPPDLRKTGMFSPVQTAPPSRGRLNNVTIRFFDELRQDPQTPVLTMTTNNVVFDNETFLIFTEGFRDEKGEVIPNDQVPVHVTGDDMDFDGRGMTLRWNDADGRLELLEIAHGDVMTIKHPGHFSPTQASPPRRRKTAAPGVALMPGRPLPEMLAARDKRAEQQIIRHRPEEPAPKPHRTGGPRAARVPAAPVTYLASFHDQVVITQPNPSGQGNQLEMTGDRMDVYFLMKQTAASPATRPAAAQAPAAGQPTPATSPAGTPGPAARGGPTPPRIPSTQPAEPPVYVRWTGILRMTPVKSEPPAPLAPGDSAVSLVATPVTVHHVDPNQHTTQDIRCGSLLYLTAGEKVLLSRSDRYPHVLITDAPGPKSKEQRATRIDSSGTVQYGRVDQKILLGGPGQAEVPIESDQKNQHPLLQASWTRQALFDLTRPEGGEQPTIHQAHFAGNVDVRHPRLALKSQELDLLFEPHAKAAAKPKTGEAAEPRPVQSDLRQVVASKDVFCTLEDSQGRKQNIDCQRLVLDTSLADQKIYPRHLNATGTVHAWGEDDLRAGYLDVVMAPVKKAPAATRAAAASKSATRAAEPDTTQVQLDSMLARENVVARAKDGSVAEGQELRVTTIDGKQHVVLTSPAQAKVTDADGNIVAGPSIEVDPDDGLAHVTGPGSLHLVKQKEQPAAPAKTAPGKAKLAAATPEAKKPTPPTDVSWLGAADFDGRRNRIDVTGSVVSKSVDRNGTVNTAVADYMRIDLRTKPKPPATQPVAAAAASSRAAAHTRPAGAMATPKMDLFANKEMMSLRMENRAAVTSTLRGADGGILQQMELTAPVIILHELADDGTPSRSLTVPAPGKMLVRDHRPPDKPTAAAQSNSPNSDDANAPGGARGATAFEWHRQLVYTESTRRADMSGAVRVVHLDEDPKQPPVELDAENVTAFFESAPRNPKAAKKDDGDAAPQLKMLTATGPSVQVVRKDQSLVQRLIAREIDYDPHRHELKAIGSPRNPVVFDNGGAGQTTADSATWNTITWDCKFINPIVIYRPASPPPTNPGGRPFKPDSSESRSHRSQ